MRRLVTGSTGLLGNNIVRFLRERGEAVRVLVRPGRDPRPIENLGLEQVVGDITDAASVTRAVDGVDGVLHAAGLVQIGWSHESRHDRVNRLGTLHVGQACLEHRVPLVHISTVNALGIGDWNTPATEDHSRPGITPCPYVLSKQAANVELAKLAAAGLRTTIVYPGFLLGPWDWKPSSGKMLLQVAQRFMPFAPTGGFSICDPRAVAESAVTALEHLSGIGSPDFTDSPRAPETKGTTSTTQSSDTEIRGFPRHYILAGENLSYLQAWRLFAKVSGARGPIYLSGPLMRFVVGRFADWWGRRSGQESDLNSAAIHMSCLPHYFCSERAVRELRYRVGSAERATLAAWKWFKECGYA
jgi:dihydroflavonol-4-reductase